VGNSMDFLNLQVNGQSLIIYFLKITWQNLEDHLLYSFFYTLYMHKFKLFFLFLCFLIFHFLKSNELYHKYPQFLIHDGQYKVSYLKTRFR
jgi:hypothetical protein